MWFDEVLDVTLEEIAADGAVKTEQRIMHWRALPLLEKQGWVIDSMLWRGCQWRVRMSLDRAAVAMETLLAEYGW